ncbi:MAG TPA: MazG nucleotide pyrophosphohydrolase domain-containing protein [Micrococcaceae bacterium]|jgi:XTP/dITP diphosphohydrolase
MSQSQASVDRLVEVIALLREHCPWMAALTHESLAEYLVEESYELLEALETGNSGEIQGELGDVLLQVVLHARLAEEEGGFNFAGVARSISDKMVRRNPHVFRSDGSLQQSFPATVDQIEATWHQVKKQEQPAGHAFTGIPAALPALALAQKSLDRASRAGLALDTVGPAGLTGAPRTEEDLGELLLAVVRSARENGLDAERALRAAVRRFQDRTASDGQAQSESSL